MKRNRLFLPNNCSCSSLSVYPKNWKTCKASALKKTWRISYYFYDASRPAPKHAIVVKGMNEYKTLESRRAVTRAILEDVTNDLYNGYNPYEKKFIQEQTYTYGSLHPNLTIIDAFRAALKKMNASDKYKNDTRIAIDRIEKAIHKLRMSRVVISEFRRRQLKELMDIMALPNANYNKHKEFYSSLYNVLVEYECADTNITRDIRKKKIVKKQREALQYHDVIKIINYLKKDNYPFSRYAMIFLLSGARSSELLSVQSRHVRLDKQEYDVLIKKGTQYIWETKIIIKSAIPYWKEVLSEVKSKDDYLFSFGLVPGPNKNNNKQITVRWRRHVKHKLTFDNGKVRKIESKKDIPISADFYSLKHTFLDYLDAKTSIIDLAQGMASHRSGSITHRVYTIGKKRRENELLKQISV